MAYDDGLAQRVREALGETADVVEKRMFGGLAFLVAGNMCVGIIGEELIARVGRDAEAGALSRPGARPFDTTGRPMRGWVMVGAAGLEDDDALTGWVGEALTFATSLPPK